MNRVPKDIAAAARARWLSDLAEALDDAHQVTSRFGPLLLPSAEGMELRARLAAARAQVQGLRLARGDDRGGELDPKWRNPLWPGGADGRRG